MLKFILVALAATYAGVAGAQMYRWVDKDGRVHYTDAPPAGGAAKSVQQRSGTPSVIDTSQAPYAVQQAAKNFPVTIYTAPSCGGACNEARALLTKRGIPHREVAVGDDKSRAELKRVSGEESVPVMTVGRGVTRGFDAEAWHSALDAAGYPRYSAPLAAEAQKPAAAPVPAPASGEAPKPAAAEPTPRGPYSPQ